LCWLQIEVAVAVVDKEGVRKTVVVVMRVTVALDPSLYAIAKAPPSPPPRAAPTMTA